MSYICDVATTYLTPFVCVFVLNCIIKHVTRTTQHLVLVFVYMKLLKLIVVPNCTHIKLKFILNYNVV